MSKRLSMKLGPALKLRSLVMQRLGPSFSEMCVHCAHCHSRLQTALMEQQQQRGSRDRRASSGSNSSSTASVPAASNAASVAVAVTASERD